MDTSPDQRRAGGFSILEMMVAMFVLIVLLGILVATTNSVSETVLWSSSKIDAFATARTSFDLMARRLSTATLGTYWDYTYPKKADGTPDTTQSPLQYIRQSDLQFLIRPNEQNPAYGQEVYFQSPESYSLDADSRMTRGLLNASGFYVQYCDNAGFRPATVSAPRWRYRLMQGFEPTEILEVFRTPTSSWINRIRNGKTTVSPNVTPLADNVIALLVWPRKSALDVAGASLSADYAYDSRKGADQVPQPVTANQLPPTIQLTMVTISEGSAIRLDAGATPPDKVEEALEGRFEKSDEDKYTSDLQGISDRLTQGNIEFHIFNTAVTLREAKWSDEN